MSARSVCVVLMALTAATAFAVARPKSLCPWKCTGISGPTSSRVRSTSSPTASGPATPIVSTTTTSEAPASVAVVYAAS